MKIIDCVQGSPEWWSARMGRPTASCFDKIVKPEPQKIAVPVDVAHDVIAGHVWEGINLSASQLEELENDGLKAGKSRKYCYFTGLAPSSQRAAYRNKLIAERLGVREEEFSGSPDIERGKQLEAEARDWLAMEIGEEIAEVGFCEEDFGRYGCSPDGIIWDNDEAHTGTPIELKCPKVSTAIGYLIEGKVPGGYLVQCHGHMAVTGADKCHFAVYADHESVNHLHRVILRSNYTEALKQHLVKFCDEVDAALPKVTDDPAYL